MSPLLVARRAWWSFLSAVQFLTRVPVPEYPYQPDALARAVKFFPVVGALIGAAAAALHYALAPHLPAVVTALLTVVFLVALTGCLHEDGLADAADGFFGGHSRERVLLIMRDSRIGSYGGAALILTLTARVLLISSVPSGRIAAYLIAAHILCRWTTLPLSYYLPSARAENSGGPAGQGARIAWLTTSATFLGGTLFTLIATGLLLGRSAVAPVLITVAVTLLSGLYYRHRIDGVTGDCFGATNQLAEIAVLLCGVWNAGVSL
jgi:adenosylcobinamide-GDP ribazoletransferase